MGAGLAPCKIHSVALSTLFQVLPRALVSIDYLSAVSMAAGTRSRSRIRDVFSRRSRVSALFSALPAISAARRLSHSAGKKIPATNYTVFYRYFRAEYRYPHGTAVPVWTPIGN